MMYYLLLTIVKEKIENLSAIETNRLKKNNFTLVIGCQNCDIWVIVFLPTIKILYSMTLLRFYYTFFKQ